MEHEIEYNEAMVAFLELIWGERFMVPGGIGHVENMINGIEVNNKRILDIGCGIGGPAFVLSGEYGAYVVGIDIEAPLVERAQHSAKELGLETKNEFHFVEPGQLNFPSESFDIVMSSGAFTQVENKHGMYNECLRVLKPGGHLTCYDWMKSEGEYSEEMFYWFKMEGLTYAMETPDRHEEILQESGFIDVKIIDGSDWYRHRVKDEYLKLKNEYYPRIVEMLGEEDADHFVENWRATVVVYDKGEMLQVYNRARKPI